MANEIQTAPNTTPTTDADWAAELNLRELSMKGYDGISLTEWAAGDTDRPQIAAGSVIEIDGAIAKFTAQTAITDEGGIADGWCYVKFVVSGSDVTPTLTNTFGTWDTAKQGFYDGNDRYSLHKMYRSGEVTKIYTLKQIVHTGNVYDDLSDGVYLENDSDYYPGQKIKYRLYQVAMGVGVSEAYISIAISSAGTNRRIIDVRANCLRTASSTSLGESGDQAYFITGIIVTDSHIAIRRTDTSVSYTFQVLVMYV